MKRKLTRLTAAVSRRCSTAKITEINCTKFCGLLRCAATVGATSILRQKAAAPNDKNGEITQSVLDTAKREGMSSNP